MNEKGVAVIMAMWLLAVLAIIGTTFAYMMRLEPIIARTHRDDMKALYVAQAGIDHAVCILKQDADRTIDHLDETWASGFTDQVLLDEAGYSVGYYTVTISDESGKTNLNTAPKDQLVNLDDIGSTRADAIITYREGSYSPFETIDELMCVEGILSTIFNNNKELITVHTTDGKTNINTAHYRVLKGLPDGGSSGLTEAEARDIVDFRDSDTRKYDPPDNENPGAENTELYTTTSGEEESRDRIGFLGDGKSDKPFEEIGNYGDDGIPKLGDANNIDNSEVASLTPYVSIKSQGSFTILSTGKYVSPSGQETVKKIRVVVDRGAPGDESRIKYYREEAEEQ